MLNAVHLLNVRFFSWQIPKLPQPTPWYHEANSVLVNIYCDIVILKTPLYKSWNRWADHCHVNITVNQTIWNLLTIMLHRCSISRYLRWIQTNRLFHNYYFSHPPKKWYNSYHAKVARCTISPKPQVTGRSSLINFACIGVAPLQTVEGSNSNTKKMDQTWFRWQVSARAL